MKTFTLFLAALLLQHSTSQACTTFSLTKSPGKIVAKSFEWDSSMGMAVHNKRNVEKSAILLKGTNPLKWTSRYSSLTFSQYGREFPLSGMNEQGLVVEIMVLNSSVYPGDGPLQATNEAQWIQYILDSSANTEEAVANARKIRIAKLLVPVHYLACDASGACASFEYIGGKLDIHTGATMPVPTLTNNTYSESVNYLKGFQGFGGRQPVPNGKDSLSRFVRASYYASQYNPAQDPVAYSLDSLKQFSDRTQWSLVWEPQAQRVHFRSLNSQAVKTIDISALSPSCRSAVKMIDVEEGGLSGNITRQLRDYSRDYAQSILKKNARFELAPVALDYVDGMTFCRE